MNATKSSFAGSRLAQSPRTSRCNAARSSLVVRAGRIVRCRIVQIRCLNAKLHAHWALHRTAATWAVFSNFQPHAEPTARRPLDRSTAHHPLPLLDRSQGPGKDWEHQPLTKNGKPVLLDLHVKTGDNVKVISGADKGTVGKIKTVNRKTGQVVIEGVNVRTRHVKPMGEEEGQIVKSEKPIHHSNVQHYSEAQGVVSRVGHKMEGGKKVRYLKKTGEVLPN